MNMKTGVLLLTLLILAGVPESIAHPQYLTSLSEVYGDGSCSTCHVSASGGGPRNDYGTLFENQPDHATNPSAALMAIGSPTAAMATNTPTSTPAATETPAETPSVTTVTATGTPASPGFGIVVSLAGLFAWSLLARRRNK